MKSEVKRLRNNGRLNIKSIKKNVIVHTHDYELFSIKDIGGNSYQLLQPIGKVVSYIPDCDDEQDDEDDFDCDVMGYQKWLAFDLNFNVEKKIVLHFFISKWTTAVKTKDIYDKITSDYINPYLRDTIL